MAIRRSYIELDFKKSAAGDREAEFSRLPGAAETGIHLWVRHSTSVMRPDECRPGAARVPPGCRPDAARMPPGCHPSMTPPQTRRGPGTSDRRAILSAAQ